MKRAFALFVLVATFTSAPVGGQMSTSKDVSGIAGSQVFTAFTGGSVWTSATTGTCIWYFPVFGNVPLASLFAPDASGSPAVDKEHSYLIWVSDWRIQAMFQNTGFGGSAISMAVVPPGTATIYFSDNPASRDWSDTNQRSTWGVPIATFVRGGGLFQSPDGFQFTDKFYFSAKLVKSKEITMGGNVFKFRELMPHGMTCFEYGQAYSTTETGSCIVLGD